MSQVLQGPRRPPHRKGIMPGEKAKDFKGTIGRLFRYLGRYHVLLVFVFLFAIGSTVFSILGPRILGSATTTLFNGLAAKLQGTGGIDFPLLGKILLLLLGVYALASLLSFMQGWFMSGVAQKTAYRMRQDISRKINRLPLGYFESKTVGEVLSRITNDVDTLGQSLAQSVAQLVISITTVLGILIMMLTISPLMSLIVFVVVPLSVLLIKVVVKHSQKYFTGQQAYLGKLNGQVEEVYSGHNVIRAFNREEESLREFSETNEALYRTAWRSHFLSGLLQPIMGFIGNLGYVAVAVSGSMLAAAGAITVGDIQAFIQYVKQFTQPISQLAQVSNMLQSMAAAAERVFEFLDEPEEAPTESPYHPVEIKGAVEFRHVRFGYQPDKIVIRDFSAEIKPGQMVAIVGPTGAGKTTMVKLLMRFYDVNDGSILIDGHDLREFDRRELREAFGMVLQDTWLFEGSILENIRYGRLDATDEEVYEAARVAGADHFIHTLPGGYQMQLTEDASNISEGERQLLTIARAILADNRILILDEATSSVDTRTERLIQTAMAALMKGRTAFVIAHRLSTIRDADLILVVKNGDIIEKGTHQELLAAGGAYAELYNSQFEKGAD